MSDVRKAMDGDKEAFNRLVLQNKTVMYKTAILVLKNDDDVYDAIQDTLIKMYKGITRLKSEDAFKLWSRTILLNSCYDIIKKNKKIIELNSAMIENFEETREDIYECEDNTVKLLDNLDPDLKLTTMLFYYDDLSVNEISEILKIPVGTVKSRLSRAREKLYTLLNNERRDV